MRLKLVGIGICLQLLLPNATFGQATTPDQAPQFNAITGIQPRAAARHLFDDGLKRVGSKARVSNCVRLLSAHVGRVENIYTAKCALSNGAQLMMCADTAIGEFALSENSGDLIEFAHANCPGG
jgi:hypothetical protein